MKTKGKGKRVDLFVIDSKGVKCPCYWQDRWVIGTDTSTDCAFFVRFTPPKPGQVIGYKPERFCPSPNNVVYYLMDRVYATGGDWTFDGVLSVIKKMCGHFMEHCSRAREAAAAQPGTHPVRLIGKDPELCKLWTKFALEEKTLFNGFAEEVRKNSADV